MRKETDSMGEMELPVDALYGASTQRAVLNFPVSGHRLPPPFIRALGLLKFACARANCNLGLLPAEKSRWIEQVGWELYQGQHAAQFPLDVFQTGSGTSTHMNVNEVIANRASVLSGEPLGSKRPIHPNDDCNLGQSSNDIIPSALHLSLALELDSELRPALEALRAQLQAKSALWRDAVKIARTHLMDATPITLGQEFSAFESQVSKALARVDRSLQVLQPLAVGGTAVGTGLNAHSQFAAQVVAIINAHCGMTFCEAPNHFEAQSSRDDCVEVAGQLAAICAALTKIANDIRWLGSGPRCGLGELQVPAVQPGSSVMPGKVNPVMSEMLLQTCLYVQGQCQTALRCGCDGQFQLNATLPLLAYSLHESIRCLSRAVTLFAERCVAGLQLNAGQLQANVERALMLVTALNPHIGYDNGARVVQRAYAEGKSLRAVVLEERLMEPAALDAVLDPLTMIGRSRD